MFLIYLSFAWVLGIFLGTRFAPPAALIFSGLSPLLLLFFAKQRKKEIALLSLSLLALLGGAYRFQSSLPASGAGTLGYYNGQGADIRGMVDADPEVGDRNTRLRFSASEINAGEGWQKVSGDALLVLPRYPAFEYGDRLLVKGRLEALVREGVYSTMFYPRIEVLDTGGGSGLMRWVYSVRSRLSDALARALPEPQASLAQGILLGMRRNIPSQVNDAFSRSGTAHLLAISGQNLSIVAGILLALGIWLFGRRHHTYIWLALAVIWLYSILTGMQPPVLRAAIMASLFLAAEMLGRQRNALPALAFAAAVMVGISPQILWSASFQLSFLAMAGLVLIAPPLMSLGRKVVAKPLGDEGAFASTARMATDSFAVSLAAVLAVWPVVAFYFGIVSLAGPVATFLALPAMPGAIVTTALTSSVGLAAFAPAYVLGWIAWLFLSYMLAIASGFAALPVSAVEVGAVSPALLWAYYSILATTIWAANNRKRLSDLSPRFRAWLNATSNKAGEVVSRVPMKWVVPPLLIVAILLVVAVALAPDDRLHVSFLDVGQGDSILVQRGRQQVLIDGGPTAQPLLLELSDRMPLWDRTIEMVVLTHPHADHLTGLVEVLKRYRVERVLSAGLESGAPLYREWRRLISEGEVRQTTAREGMQIDLGDGVTIDILNAGTALAAGSESDVDDSGVVLRISEGKVSFLLTADIGWEAEMGLIARRAELRSTVLKVAHHGSDTSTTQEFLEVTDPQAAAISVGKDNGYGHPSRTVLERLQGKVGTGSIYRTDRDGTIEFTTDGKRLWVKRGK